MKILVASDNRFWRRSLGSHQRIYALLEFLHSRGHELEVLFIGAPTAEDGHLMQSIPFADVRPTLPAMDAGDSGRGSSARSRRDLIKAVLREFLQLLRRLPGELGYFIKHRKIGMSLRFDLALSEPKLRDFFRPLAIEQLNAALARWQPDVLMVEYLRLSYLVRNMPIKTRKKLRTILDTHDVLFERRARFHASGLAHDIDITAAEEAASLGLYDAIIAIQSRDAAAFQLLAPTQRVIVAGHGQEIFSRRRDFNKNLRFLFLGSDMGPNQDAVSRLVFRIWPRIYSHLDNAVTLSIVGRAGSVLQRQTLPPGVEVKGFVDSLEEIYQTHDIFLNPVGFGGGLKIKNIEALAHGLVLVTTSVGAEGMEDASGTAYLIADEDQVFADTAISLGMNEVLRTSLAGAALVYAEKYLGVQETYRELDEYLLGIC